MRRILRLILNLAVTIIFLVGIGIIGLYLIGIVPTIVTSGSMEPKIPTGSLCLIDRRYPIEKLEIGDVIVYLQPNQKVIHRIYAKDETGIRTKGDANHHIDGMPTTKENYYGKYLYSIPKIGFYIYYLQSTKGKIIFISVLICIYISWYFVNRKKEKIKWQR